MKQNIIVGTTILASFIIFIGFKLTGQTNLEQQLSNAPAYKIYGIIDSAKVSVFSKDKLIQENISDQDYARWQTVVNSSNIIVRQLAQIGHAPADYLETVEKLNAILENITTLITALNAQDQNPSGNLLSVPKQQIQGLIRTTGIIMQKSLNTIKEASKPPASWTNRVPKNIDVILGQYQDFFDQFKTKQSVNDGFIVANLSNFNINSPKKITRLIDALEQYIYRSRIKWWQVHRKVIKNKHLRHDVAKKLIAIIRALYPDTVSSLDIALFGISQDKASVIIFAQASAYNSVCRQLLREIDLI